VRCWRQVKVRLSTNRETRELAASLNVTRTWASYSLLKKQSTARLDFRCDCENAAQRDRELKTFSCILSMGREVECWVRCWYLRLAAAHIRRRYIIFTVERLHHSPRSVESPMYVLKEITILITALFIVPGLWGNNALTKETTCL
jgi:hypothetical protein